MHSTCNVLSIRDMLKNISMIIWGYKGKYDMHDTEKGQSTWHCRTFHLKFVLIIN